MPVKHGYTPEMLGNNISEFVKMGYLHKNAVTIAFEVARSAYRKEYPVGNFPKHLQGAGKFYRKNPSGLPKRMTTRSRAKIKRKPIKQLAGRTVSYPAYEKVGGKYIKKNPKSYPNIDKSAFRKGEYVGYANGVWLIRNTNPSKTKKVSASWLARKRDEPGKNDLIFATSLLEMSEKLQLHADKALKKNPVVPLKVKGAKFYKSLSPDDVTLNIAGKMFYIWDAFPNKSMAIKYAYGLGEVTKLVDLGKDAGRLRYAVFTLTGNNPVRPLKKKKFKGVYYVGLYSKRIRYYLTDKETFDSDIKKALTFISGEAANEKREALQNKYSRRFDVFYRST